MGLSMINYDGYMHVIRLGSGKWYVDGTLVGQYIGYVTEVPLGILC